jgi:hypothetical protein
VAGLVTVAWSTRLEAQPPDEGLSLVWNAPAGCPPASFVQDRIRDVMGAGVRPSSPVQAEVSVQHGPDGVWRLTLDTTQDGQRGRRAFEADSCTAVTEAAALVMAMMIDPNARLEPRVPSPRPTEDRPRPSRPRSGAGVRAAPRAAGQSSMQLSLSPAMTLDWGSLPSPTMGAGAVWDLVWGAASVGFHGTWFPDRRETSAQPSAGVEVGLLAAGVQGCIGGTSEVSVMACVGGEAGSLRADAFGVSRTQRAHPFWAGLTGGGKVRTPARGPLSAWVDLGMVLVWTRPRIELSPYGEVFRPAPVAGRVSAGVSYHF